MEGNQRVSEPNVVSEYVTVAESGEILMVAPKTIHRWAAAGRIPHVVTAQGRRRFSRSQIAEIARRLRRGG